MNWKDWVDLIFAAIFIAVGVAFFVSPAFGRFAYEYTSQGVMWKAIVGEKRAPTIAKYFFSLISVALGAWVILTKIYPQLLS